MNVVHVFRLTVEYEKFRYLFKPDMVQNGLVETNRSQGTDEIHAKLFKELSSIIATPVGKLFQSSLEQGAVPQVIVYLLTYYCKNFCYTLGNHVYFNSNT